MEALRRLLRHDPMDLVAPLVVFVAAALVGVVVSHFLKRALRRWNARTLSRPSLILLESVRPTLNLWVLVVALHLALQSADLPVKYDRWGTRAVAVVLVVSLTMMFARLAGELIRHYGGQIHGPLPVTTLTRNLAQVAVVILGILVLLNQLGIPITPVLTALGVGGLAVALALQDTLSNLFSGFYVAIAGQVRLGDYIKLNTGEEGYVTDIGWRSTSLRALANNLIIVPNNKLSQAIVTNYTLPEKRLGVSVQVNVGPEHDLEGVERLLGDVVRQAAAEVPGALREPPPSVMFDPGFGESALGFTVSCQVEDFSQQFPVRHELRKRIYRRLREQGIAVALPARIVYVREDGAKPA